METLFADRPLADWAALLAEVDCCFEPVLEPSEVSDHPQVAARGLVTRHQGADPRVEVGFAALLDGAPPALRPALVEHTADEVLSHWRDGPEPG